MYGEISSLLKLSSLPWETETACTVGSCSKRGAGRCGGGLRGEKPSPRGETIPRCSHRSSHLSHAGAPDSCRSADDLQLVSVGMRLGLALGWIGWASLERYRLATLSLGAQAVAGMRCLDFAKDSGSASMARCLDCVGHVRGDVVCSSPGGGGGADRCGVLRCRRAEGGTASG